MSDSKQNFRLTKDQQRYLDSLVCERISDNEINRVCIDTIFNESKNGITWALYNGWNDDKQDKLAYYMVRDPKDDLPMMFFSLKCGEVSDPLDLEKKRKKLNNAEALLRAAHGMEAPEWAKNVIEKRKVNGILPRNKVLEIEKRYLKAKKEADDFWWDFAREYQEEGENIVRTDKTYAGVELVHFLVHKPANDRWAEKGMKYKVGDVEMGRTLGRTMFWKFVVPVIQSVRDLVGLEYLYLFAADQSRNRRLINYYTEMGFEIRKDINVNKPRYDFTCVFMIQKVISLRKRGQEFFREYNNPVDPHEL